MEKKINWKKIAVTAGVFAAGIAIGAIGGEKILGEISLDGMSELTAATCAVNGKKLLHITLCDKKTGRRLTSYVDKTYLGNLLEFLSPLMDDTEFK